MSKLFEGSWTADAVVAFAMASPDNYVRMAERENEVWSRLHTTPEFQAQRKQDQEAAARLHLNRGRFAILRWLAKERLTFERGLSVGCGEGRAERHYVSSGIVRSFFGVDIAEASIAEARRQNDAAGMANTYAVADVNFADFGTDAFDFVLAQTSLHHLVHLENAFAAIWRALKPGGLFFLHDRVGESQFQHAPARVAEAEAILKDLPPELRRNRINGRDIYPIHIPAPGKLVSPFESIRSGEILDLADHWFTPVAGGTFSSILHLAVPMGTRQNYVEHPDGPDIFERIVARDRELLDTGALRGVDARIVYRKREVPRD